MSTYSFSGKPQFFTATTGGTYQITAYGGQGGRFTGSRYSNAYSGGGGAEMGGTFTLTKGEKLEIIVAGAGSASGGFSYHGAGGAGGGGGTFVLEGLGGGKYTPLLVAGGGGGGGYTVGGDGQTTPGNGSGGAKSTNNNGGGGGAGYKSDGGASAYGGRGGSNRTGAFAGGAGTTEISAGKGGFGGGGGGGFGAGGGGGGYSGGAGGSSGAGGGGGGSLDKGVAFVAKAGVNSGNGKVILSAVTCFASGTSIRTTRGDVAVEDLAAGDLVVTASGRHRPIRWLGHRTIDCRKHSSPTEVASVRIAAHAFGHCLPARDLYLSPGHPVLVGANEGNEGGHLVPITCLINGTSVRRVSSQFVTYWHVELDRHDILLAENLPAESYLDWGDRAFFTEGADHALQNPDFVVPGLAGRCRPVAVDGPVVEAERKRLDDMFAIRLAAACVWPSADTLFSIGDRR